MEEPQSRTHTVYNKFEVRLNNITDQLIFFILFLQTQPEITEQQALLEKLLFEVIEIKKFSNNIIDNVRALFIEKGEDSCKRLITLYISELKKQEEFFFNEISYLKNSNEFKLKYVSSITRKPKILSNKAKYNLTILDIQERFNSISSELIFQLYKVKNRIKTHMSLPNGINIIESQEHVVPQKVDESEESKNLIPELTVKEIALLYIYNGKKNLGANEASTVAASHNRFSQTSGKQLYDDFNIYKEEQNRTSANLNIPKAKRMKKRITNVLPLIINPHC